MPQLPQPYADALFAGEKVESFSHAAMSELRNQNVMSLVFLLKVAGGGLGSRDTLVITPGQFIIIGYKDGGHLWSIFSNSIEFDGNPVCAIGGVF